MEEPPKPGGEGTLDLMAGGTAPGDRPATPGGGGTGAGLLESPGGAGGKLPMLGEAGGTGGLLIPAGGGGGRGSLLEGAIGGGSGDRLTDRDDDVSLTIASATIACNGRGSNTGSRESKSSSITAWLGLPDSRRNASESAPPLDSVFGSSCDPNKPARAELVEPSDPELEFDPLF
ncbi:hypothetical protein ACFL5O_01630 [Myxococcota bacterium]